jgi:hypothetical protein
MPLQEKQLGPLVVKIDRPKGYVKKWPATPEQPNGREWVYPIDYGYLPGILGQDGEGLDVFAGNEPNGHMMSFLKTKKDEQGKVVPDETKFVLCVTDAQLRKILSFYGDEATEKEYYSSWPAVFKAIAKHKPKRKRRYQQAPMEQAKAAAFRVASRVYGVKISTLQDMIGSQLPFEPTSDSASPGHQRYEEIADILDKTDRAFKSFDDRKPQNTGDESAWGSFFQDSVIG